MTFYDVYAIIKSTVLVKHQREYAVKPHLKGGIMMNLTGLVFQIIFVMFLLGLVLRIKNVVTQLVCIVAISIYAIIVVFSFDFGTQLQIIGIGMKLLAVSMLMYGVINMIELHILHKKNVTIAKKKYSNIKEVTALIRQNPARRYSDDKMNKEFYS